MTNEKDNKTVGRPMRARNKNPDPRRDTGDGGLRDHELYAVWNMMKQRCTNPSHKDYQHYGGRGIKVCDRWANSFENFLEDVGERPEPHPTEGKYTIDRVDASGDYTPNNTTWATHTSQSRNRTNTRYLEYKGERKSLAEWAEVSNLSYGALESRLNNGWTIEKALETPMAKTSSRKGSGKTIKAFGEAMTAAQWSEQHGVAVKTIQNRIRKGWHPEDAVSKRSGEKPDHPINKPEGAKKKGPKAKTYEYQGQQVDVKWIVEKTGLRSQSVRYHLAQGRTVEQILNR